MCVNICIYKLCINKFLNLKYNLFNLLLINTY